MINQNKSSSKVAEYLLQINAVKLNSKNPFKWASGWNSPIYCDNRKILGHPEIRSFIKEEFINLISEFKKTPDCIAGVATGGIAIGSLVAESLGLPFCYVRSSAKGHGLNNKIEGDLEVNQNTFVIEDLISSGKSSLDAVEALKKYGVNVIGLGAIFTYGFDYAEKKFKEAGCLFKTLTDYDCMLETAINKQYIEKIELSNLKKWRQSPSDWESHA